MTFDVSKLLRSKETRELHLLNIDFMFVTFEVSKPDTSREFNEPQL